MKSAGDIRAMKGREGIAMLTVYDFPGARMLQGTGVDLLLVGDSLANVVYGLPSTRLVTLDTMLRHTDAVRRGAPDLHVVGDMPFGSYDNPELAVQSALAFRKVGADSVKMENPPAETIQAVLAAGIPVMGHVGLTPQTITVFKKQGRDEASARRIRDEMLAEARSGCFAIVAEAVPDALARDLTALSPVPIIGIASGPDTDGQVLVFHDVFGFDTVARPYVTRQADVHGVIHAAAVRYVETVKRRQPPVM